MSDVPERLRREVFARADGSCEYCMIPVAGQIAWFPVDHIVPRSRGGETTLGNLALACPRCNAHKWAADAGTDPQTGQHVPLFNPREQAWDDHFAWSSAVAFHIEGRTPCGRATVDRLKMNEPEIVAIRRVLAELGVAFRHRG